MKKREFTSIFAKEIQDYLKIKISLGFQERSFKSSLNIFDQFCLDYQLIEPIFTKKLAEEWIKKRKNEASTTHYNRINHIKHFLIFLTKIGYNVFLPRDISFKNTDFQPHIYTIKEIKRYFLAVDTFDSLWNKKDKIQYPIIFRLLYCCGTRINETLSIKRKDVDLSSGVIKLHKTKNKCERYIVLSSEMSLLMRQFATKCFYLLSDDDYIFTSANGGRCCCRTVYNHHRLFLNQAKIPFLGNHKGPRIHDWRSTFAVYSFKQMIDSGLDMYVALPILSTHLGHKSIYATERYIRLTINLFPYIEEKLKSKLDVVFGGEKS